MITILAAVPVMLYILIISFSSGVLLLDSDKPLVITDGWQYNWEGSEKSDIVNVPVHVTGGLPNQTLHLQRMLPNTAFNNPTLFLRTSQQYVTVYLNGSLIYQYDRQTLNPHGKSPGSCYHFVSLPNYYIGGRIDIYLTSPFKQYTGTISAIQVGNMSSHLLSILKNQSFSLILSATILIGGLILVFLFATLIIMGTRLPNILFLGLFAIFSGIWMASESKVIGLFIQSPIFILNMALLSQYLMPIPILAFIKRTYLPRKHRWLTRFEWIFTGFFMLASLLKALNFIDLIEILSVFHGLVAICVIFVLVISIMEIIHGKKNIRIFFAGCMVLALFSGCDMIIFHFSDIPWVNAHNLFQVGMLIFFLIAVASLAHHILAKREKELSHEILLSLAYTDTLTGFKNRTSFEQTMAYFNVKIEKYTSIHLVMLDINDLKAVNDQFGHKEGDRLIIEGAAIMNDTLGRLGEVYRIGGDEFAIIIADVEPYFIQIEIDNMNQRIRSFNMNETIFKMSIAYGVDSFVKGSDKDLHPVFDRADKAMYCCKETQKKAI